MSEAIMTRLYKKMREINEKKTMMIIKRKKISTNKPCFILDHRTLPKKKFKVQ